MSGGSALETLLKRDRVLVFAALAAVIALAWAYVLTGAGMTMPDMDGMSRRLCAHTGCKGRHLGGPKADIIQVVV